MTYRVLGHGPPLFSFRGSRRPIAPTPSCSTGWPIGSGPSCTTTLASIPTTAPTWPGIGHDHLVDDLFGLIDHLKIGRVFPVGVSFGSTIVLKALCREPRRFPRAAVQGAFAYRDFTRGERWALRLGRLVPGNVARLPLRRPILDL